MSFNVGINVLEVDGKATPSIQAAPTSVAAFVIRSQRGVPHDAVRRVTNWSQFTEYFGGYKENAFGAYAVRGFFDNGGTKAYVTRVAKNQAGQPTVASLASAPAEQWKSVSEDSPLVFASDEGEKRAEFVETSVAELAAVPPGDDASTFNLEPEDGGPPLQIEVTVDGGEKQVCTFEQGGVPPLIDKLEEATPHEVAASLNYRLSGIRAWVKPAAENGGQLENGEAGPDAGKERVCVATDRRGSDAQLKVEGTAFDALGLTGDQAEGAGNVDDLAKVHPEEALAILKTALGEEHFSVQLTEQTELRIERTKAGDNTWIQCETEENPFGFSIEKRAGGGDLTAAAAASCTLLDSSEEPALQVEAGYRGSVDPGEWGEELSVKVINGQPTGVYRLEVEHDQKVVETWENLAHSDPNDGGSETDIEWNSPEDVINSAKTGSKFIKVKVEPQSTHPGDTVDPETGEGIFVPLLGGNDDQLTDPELKTELREAFDRFETYEVQLVCCPESLNDEELEKEVATAGLAYCSKQGDCMFVGHTPKDLDAIAAEGYARALRGDKVYGALYFPWVEASDPSGGSVWIPPTGHILGVYARTERERGIWKAPAGNAAQLRGVLDVKQHITDADHTSMVKNANLNAVRFISGKGIVIDSSRTLSTGGLWLYVNVRLLFNFVKSSLKSGLRWVVQEPNDEALWNKVKYNSVTPFLMGLWRRGAFGPGSPDDVFTVKIDGENNPGANIKHGILNIEVYFYPSRPAETIIITIGQQEGGASAGEG